MPEPRRDGESVLETTTEKSPSNVPRAIEIGFEDSPDEYYEAVLNERQSNLRDQESKLDDWRSMYDLANSDRDDTMDASKRFGMMIQSIPATMASAIPYAVSQEPILGILPIGVAAGSFAILEEDIRKERRNQEKEQAAQDIGMLEEEVQDIRYDVSQEAVEQLLSESIVVTYEHSSERFLASEGSKTAEQALREYSDVMDVLEARSDYWEDEEESVPLSQSETKLMEFEGSAQSIEDEFIRENIDMLQSDYDDEFSQEQYEQTVPSQLLSMKEIEEQSETLTIYRLRVNTGDENKLDAFGVYEGSIDELEYISDESMPVTEALRQNALEQYGEV